MIFSFPSSASLIESKVPFVIYYCNSLYIFSWSPHNVSIYYCAKKFHLIKLRCKKLETKIDESLTLIISFSLFSLRRRLTTEFIWISCRNENYSRGKWWDIRVRALHKFSHFIELTSGLLKCSHNDPFHKQSLVNSPLNSTSQYRWPETLLNIRWNFIIGLL